MSIYLLKPLDPVQAIRVEIENFFQSNIADKDTARKKGTKFFCFFVKRYIYLTEERIATYCNICPRTVRSHINKINNRSAKADRVFWQLDERIQRVLWRYATIVDKSILQNIENS